MQPGRRSSEDVYNATIHAIRPVADGLVVFSLKPDEPIPDRLPGHYVSIGLFDESVAEPKLIRRPYSVSCSLDGRSAGDLIELYVVLVPEGNLTPLLFRKVRGDRLFLNRKMYGNYTLPALRDDMTIILASTGTGIAPHLTMLGPCVTACRNVVVMDCVRYRAELAYAAEITRFCATHPNLRYIPIVTREGTPKTYIQDYFSRNIFEHEYAMVLSAADTHVFACGNPAMIGIPRQDRKTGEYSFPVDNGLVEILMNRFGLKIHKTRDPGQIHFEKYW